MARLLAAQVKTAGKHALDDVTIEWCPLTHALGFTASGQHIYLDAGLRVGTVDLVAEVLAHELVHVRQFRALGTDGFKCAYVQAFIDCGAFQCGFCTPGFVLMARQLLDAHPDPSEDEIRHYLAGNLCRCGAYPQIIEAVKLAARKRKGGEQ